VEVTRGDPTSFSQPAEDTGRRAVYQALIDGKHARGHRESITFCVYTLDLDEGRGDLYVAAGLALGLNQRGFGVRLADRSQWQALEPTDVVVGMLPTFEPIDAGDAWTIAWVRNETDTWARRGHLPAYDQVLASSHLAAQRLERSVHRVEGVLPIGVDTQLFSPPTDGRARLDTAVTTAHFWGSVRDAHRALMELPDDADVAMFGQANDAPPELLRWHRRAVPYFAIPELYRTARFVIDDMNRTTLGYGSVNSRFFEAAACGALPLVNGSLGPKALGFHDVPRYRDTAELADRLRELRADPVASSTLARHLGKQVRAEHSWDVRADRFEELLGAGQAAKRVAPPPRRPLHFFPDHRDRNPFQRMLYSGLSAVGAHAVPIRDVRGHLHARAGAGDPGVVHLHWTAPILQWAAGPYRARQAFDGFAEDLRAFKAAGGRLVWTIHSALPHDTRHRQPELELATLLSNEADRIHVLSEASLDAAAGLYPLDRTKVVVIGHASPVGEYPNWMSREAARARLGILHREKVLIAVGEHSPGDGMRRLVTAFGRLAQADPSLRLLVPEGACDETPRVLFHPGDIPGDQVQVWLGAADLAITLDPDPGGQAALLSQSFGVPVLDLFRTEDDAAWAAELRWAIRDLIADPEGAALARKEAVAAAEEFPVGDMAAQFASLVEPLLS
jgi:glycosyltransferase involved in cell wall biosynthesis